MRKNMRSRDAWGSIISFAMLLVVLSAVGYSVFHSKPAHAFHYGAEQVSLYCDPTNRHPRVDRIIIAGNNQSNHYSVYDGAPSDAGSTWIVWNWWWQGYTQVWAHGHFW